jgi:hypothetical protein
MTNAISKHAMGVSFAPKEAPDLPPHTAFMSSSCQRSFEHRGYTWNAKQGNWVDKWGMPMRMAKQIKCENGQRTARGVGNSD